MTVDSTFEDLHRARIRGLARAEDMTDVGGLVEASLLVVTERGCMLTPAGLERHEELLVAWRYAVDLGVVTTAYERFLTVNQPMKDTCAGWQSASADPEALFVTVDSLSGIVQRVKPALRRAAQTAPRFGTYAPRLDAALGAAAGGDGRFVTDPRVDSLHSIWFECHEDFLLTLDRDREEEGSF
jgi:hypothetical protein